MAEVPGSSPSDQASSLLDQADNAYRSGCNFRVLDILRNLDSAGLDDNQSVRCRVLRGLAEYDLGDVISSVSTLRSAVAGVKNCSLDVQFQASFSLFVRETDFLAPEQVLPSLSRLRQLAAAAGDARSLAGLHLAAARLEGCRGQCVEAHRHVEIARSLAERSRNAALLCSIGIVEASLESVAGNLVRAKLLAEASLATAEAERFARYRLGAATNLAMIALYAGQHEAVRAYIETVLAQSCEITHIRFGALDCLAQLELKEGRHAASELLLRECALALAADRVPARSWYDFAHQLTRCAYYEHLEDWHQIVAIADDADAELTRRQYKALRTALLCAKARALARLGKPSHAESTLATAVRVCPRGAVDPLIVLEASKALCLSLRGDASRGSVHFDRALAACRAIGHRYHEAWIERDRADIQRTIRDTVPAAPLRRDVTDTALLLHDVATILGAGHSIDILAHRLAALLEGTALGPRVEVRSESGRAYRAQPSATWESGADGVCTIRLRGSDRRVSIHVRDVEAIEEISLLKSLADLVQAAVSRTADTETEDEDLTLWPRRLVQDGEDTIFRSPRMVELLRIAERLAATNLPILITGETGTGKEVIARLIHDRSLVKRGPFVPCNCSAMPRDLVESQLFGHRRGAFTGAHDSFPGMIRAAERGTLFLDEIGDLELAAQPKLLRFLESGEIHPVGDMRAHHVAARIVAATNADLDVLCDQGRFRRDLFYRVGVARIALPPLRERKDEIPALAALFLTRFARECGRTNLRLGDDLIAALLLYDWPGNIRQLANEIRRVAALAADGETLGAAALAPDIVRNWNARPTTLPQRQGPTVEIRLDQPLTQAIEDLERTFIEHALEAAGGRVAEAAQLLGVSRKGLFLKRRRQGMVGH